MSIFLGPSSGRDHQLFDPVTFGLWSYNGKNRKEFQVGDIVRIEKNRAGGSVLPGQEIYAEGPLEQITTNGRVKVKLEGNSQVFTAKEPDEDDKVLVFLSRPPSVASTSPRPSISRPRRQQSTAGGSPSPPPARSSQRSNAREAPPPPPPPPPRQRSNVGGSPPQSSNDADEEEEEEEEEEVIIKK